MYLAKTETGESLNDLIAFVTSKLASIGQYLAACHDVGAEPLKNPALALWPAIDTQDGSLCVHIRFGDDVSLPTEASEDGLSLKFGNTLDYSGLADAVTSMSSVLSSFESLSSMMRTAHPRLIADRQRILGEAA